MLTTRLRPKLRGLAELGVEVQRVRVQGQQGEQVVLGLGEGFPPTMLVDIADFEFLEVAPKGLAVALRADLLGTVRHWLRLVYLVACSGESVAVQIPRCSRYSPPAREGVRHFAPAQFGHHLGFRMGEDVELVVPDGVQDHIADQGGIDHAGPHALRDRASLLGR